MGKFDELIDEFVFMAKNAADVASKKTGEVVEISKLKYQLKQTEWDMEKAYAKLGAIVYESKRTNEDFADAILLATSEIDDLKLKIDRLEEQLRTFKKVKRCEKCNKDNEANADYCTRCGSPLGDAPIPQPADEEDASPVEEVNEDNMDY